MPATSTYRKLGTPKFVGDEGSVILEPTGLQVDWDNVAADADGIKRIRAGELLHTNVTTRLLTKAVDTSVTADGIAVGDTDDQLGNNKGMIGVYRGGIFYENLMYGEAGTAPTAAQKTELGVLFQFVVYADDRA